MNEQELMNTMQKMIEKLLPNILQQSFTNFRTGTVSNTSNNRTCEVTLDNGTRIYNVTMPKDITAHAGSRVIVLSLNPQNSSANYIIGIY